MRDMSKTKKQLVGELEEMRQRVAVLEAEASKHVRAEEELQGKRETYRDIIEQVRDVVFEVDAVGNITLLNSAVRQWGYRPEELVGTNFIELIPEDWRDKTAVELQNSLLSAGEMVAETFVVSKRGERCPVEYSATVKRERGEYAGAQGIVRDITERKRIEEDLRRSEERYRDLVEKEKDIIYSLDVHGNITSANPAVGQWGYKPEDLLGTNFVELIPENWRERTFADFNNLLKAGEITAETALLDKKGEPHSVEYSSTVIREGKKVVGTRGIVRDITERKRAEEELYKYRTQLEQLVEERTNELASTIEQLKLDITERMRVEAELRDSESKLRTLVETITDGILVTDLQGGILEVNEAALHISGYTEQEVIGKNIFDFMAPEERAEALKELQRTLESGITSREFEYTILRADGGKIEAEFTAALLHDSAGNPIGIVGMARDITDRKRAEEVLKESETRFRELFEHMSSGVAVYEAVDDGEDFIVKDFNKAGEKISRKRRKALVGKSVHKAFTGLMEMGLLEILQRVWRTGKPEHLPPTFYEDEYVSGWRENYVYKLPSGEVVAIYDDITERIKSELAVRESEEKLRIVFESIGDAITVTDLSGKIVDLNAAGLRTFGVKKQKDIVGQEGFNFIAEKDRARAMDDMARLFEVGARGPDEYTLVTADGREFEAESSNALLRDASGNPVGFVSINRDVTERNRMQRELRESEEKLRIMFESMGEGLTITDLEGNIVDANEASVRVGGFSSKEEMIGRNGYDFIAETDRDRTRETLEKAFKKGGKAVIEYTLLDKAGLEYEGESTISPLRDSSGRIVGSVAITKNITERKLAELALRDSEEKYRSLLEHMEEGYVIVTGDRIRFANARCAEFLGIPVDKLVGETIWNLVIPEDVNKAKQTIESYVDRGIMPHLMEFKYFREDGRMVPLEVSLREITYEGKPSIAVVLRDVTERKRAEEALRESEEKLRTIFESIGDAITVTDLNGTILDENPAGVRMIGFSSKEDLIGRNGYEFIAERDRDRAVKSISAAFSKGDTATLDCTLLTRDGKEWDGEASMSLVRDSSGAPTGVVMVTKDVTGRKRMQEELRSSEEKLRFMFASMIDAVVVVDLEGKVTEINDAGVHLAGYSSREEMVGLNAFEFVAEEDRERAMGDMARSFDIGPGFMVQYKFVPRDGKHLDVEAAGGMLRDSAGDVTGFIVVVRDITERRRMEQALRESEEKLRTIFEAIDDGITVTDLEGVIVQDNSAARLMLGYTRRDRVIGKSGYEFIAERDRAKAEEYGRKLFAKRRGGTIEYALVTKDGSEIDAEIRSAVLRDSEGNPTGVVGVARDVTERKRMQEELLKSEEKLRAVFGAIADAVFVMDMDGTVQEINSEVSRILGGKSREEIIGQRGWELLPVEERGKSKEFGSRLLSGGPTGTMEFELEDPQGNSLSVESRATIIRDSSGDSIGLVGVSRDITERKRMQEELRESEEKLRFMFESIADGIISVDLEGTIVDVNEAAVRMAGYDSGEEMIGLNAFDFVAERDRERALEENLKNIAEGRGSAVQYVALDKDGREFEAEAMGAMMHDASGEPMGFITVIRDVTERSRMEAALKESEEKLRVMFENSPDFIMDVDREGNLLFINYTVPELTVEETIGTSCYNYIMPEAQADYRKTLERVFRTGKIASLDTSGLGPGGRTSYYHSRFVPLKRDGHVETVMIIATDITERMQAEQALRESEERLSSFMESATDLFTLWDSELNMVDINRAALAYMPAGKAREDYIGRNMTELQPDLRESGRYDQYLDVIQTGEPVVAEDIISHPVLGTVYFNVRAFKVGDGLGTIITDVTERRRMEAGLRGSEEKLRFMFESLGDGIAVVDREGKIVEVNDTMVRMVECESREELLGQNALEFVVERDRASAAEAFARGVEQQISATMEFAVRDRYGKEFETETNAALMRDADGNPTGFIVDIRDVSERKLMEKRLTESEEMARGMLESAATGVYVVQDGKFQYVSPLFAQITAYSSDELIGTDSLSYVHPDDREMVRQKAVEGLKGQSILPYEFRFVKRDGESVWILEKIASIEYRGRRAAIASFMDVTEHKRADEELRQRKDELEQRTNQLLALQKVTASIQSTLELKEVLQQVAEGTVTNLGYDRAFIMVLDEKRDVLKGTVFFTKDSIESVADVERVLDRVLTDIEVPLVKGYSHVMDEAMDGRSFVTHHLYEIGEPLLTREQCEALQDLVGAITIVNMPITAMGRHVGSIMAFTGREEVTELDLEPLRILADQAGIAIINATIYQGAAEIAQRLAVIGSLSRMVGSILDVREVYQTFTDELKEVIGFDRASIDLVEGDQLQFFAVASEVKTKLGEGKTVPLAETAAKWVVNKKQTNVESDFEHKRQFPIDDVLLKEGMRSAIRVPLFSKGKVFGTFNLSSRQPDAYGDRERGILEQVAGPIAAAIENSRLFIQLKEHQAQLEKAYEDLKAAQEYLLQAERLRALGEMAGGVAHDFNNILAIILGRAQLALEDVTDEKLKKDLQIIEQTATDAAGTVRRLQDFARVRLDRAFAEVDINKLVQGALEMVESRRIELKETAGVTVEIDSDLGKVAPVAGDVAELREGLVNIIFNAMDAMPEGGKITIKIEQEDGWVVIRVSDTGVGMPEEVRSRIFDPFFTTRAPEGSGLGLSVTYGIITRHGGRVDVESAIGEGTTFYIKLPVTSRIGVERQVEHGLVVVRSADILVVDDDLEVSEVLQLMLEQLGHRVTVATTGEGAVNSFEKGHYDLVITDFGMPDMSGSEVAGAIKDIRPGTPVLLITGWGVQLDKEAMPEIDGMVAKPFSKDALSRQLSELLTARRRGRKK